MKGLFDQVNARHIAWNNVWRKKADKLNMKKI